VADPRLELTFLALADPARIAVVQLLTREPLRSSEIADALALGRPATSKHLRVLRSAGLVEESALADDGRARRYALRPEPFEALRSWLDEVESFWSAQLGAFKAHAEYKHRKRRS
jgi:DNA-binding transcriptional ArsR family regulator